MQRRDTGPVPILGGSGVEPGPNGASKTAPFGTPVMAIPEAPGAATREARPGIFARVQSTWAVLGVIFAIAAAGAAGGAYLGRLATDDDVAAKVGEVRAEVAELAAEVKADRELDQRRHEETIQALGVVSSEVAGLRGVLESLRPPPSKRR